ncbi:MAG: AEC family transporter [Clostridia bacterium]|nr:AEC family transporter [Clostridia bacterium]
MGALLIMLKNVVLFVTLALPGYLLVKAKVLNSQHSGVLSKLLMYVGMPFLILSGTVNNISFDKALIIKLILTSAVGIAFTFAMFFLSKPITAMEKSEKTRGMMRFCMAFSNNGFLGIPLAVAVFGADSPVMTVLVILNIITNILMYTLGVYLVSGDKSRISLKKAFLNPVLIAFIIGVVLNLMKVNTYIPEISTFSSHFSGLVTPLSMTILGMKMAEIRFVSLFKSPRMYYVCSMKLVAFPCIILALLLSAKHLGAGIVDDSIILGFFIAFAMPTAGLASTFADGFGGDTENAVSMTLGTTVLSIFTIPIIYWVLSYLV